MEDRMQIHKVLHLLIDQFIDKFEKYIDQKHVDKNKVYIELVKRSCSLSRDITAVASTLLSTYKTADIPVFEEAIQKRISSLVETCLQQDLIEYALIAEDHRNVNLSNDDLHNILYMCSVNGSSSVTTSLHLLSGSSSEGNSLSSTLSHSHINSLDVASITNDACLPLFHQFQNSQSTFEEELLQLNNSLGMGFSMGSLKLNEEISVSDEKCDNIGSSKAYDGSYISKNIDDWLHSIITSKDAPEMPFKSFLSWENVMRQSVACHLYTTELTGKEVELNIIDEDPHTFRILHNSSGVLSEHNFFHDILDLLVGIPSTTFLYDKMQKKFQMKSDSHLLNLSHDCTSKFSEMFMEAGTVFYHLKSFCAEHINTEGLILKGFKDGIKEILSVYMEYIASVKVYNPTMNMLNTYISKDAELLSTLGLICGISCSKNEAISLPKGVGLLSYLNKASWSYKCNVESAIMVAFLLKSAYSPYFNFLNKWITEGVCCDPYNEFQIVEDIRYLDRKDELYWKFAYTNIDTNSPRSVPSELEKYSHNILQCGKSMRLLQNCCPELYSLVYMCCHPPPGLSMVFSYHAVDVKREECESYIREKEAWKLQRKKLDAVVSEDNCLIERQLTVDSKVIWKQIQKRWNRNKKFPVSNKIATNSERNKEGTLKRCQTVPDISSKCDHNSLSGIVHTNIGLLFSSCGYSCNAFENANTMTMKKPHEMPLIQDSTVMSKTKSNEEDKVITEGVLGSFTDSLATLLLSEYGDTKEDICTFVQMTSLQNLMQYNFSAVMNMRMHLIQNTIVDYIINELGFKDLLLCLRNTYFLQDEAFSQSLCKRLFNWAMKCDSLDEFADWSSLNEMLTRSVAVPSLNSISFLETASVNFVTMPEEHISRRNKFMQFFHFEFKIEWPLNIIIHKACITHYSRIFSFILEIEFLCWLLGQIWRSLLISANEQNLENSPQYRKLMLDRFDMHQFIRVLRNCIHQDLGGPLWEYLEKILLSESISIDTLETIHSQYLERALVRCFLTEETSHLHDVIEFLFQQVEKFCRSALDCSWELNPDTGHFESSEFQTLFDCYGRYQKSKETFYERLSKMVRRKKFERMYDEHYQLYLQTILETGRNM